jgi:ribosomal protein L37AE/L43A
MKAKTTQSKTDDPRKNYRCNFCRKKKLHKNVTYFQFLGKTVKDQSPSLHDAFYVCEECERLEAFREKIKYHEEKETLEFREF